MTEARDAHLVLLSLRNPLAVPILLDNWLKRWAVSRQVQEAALAVWGGKQGNALSLEVPVVVAEFAAHHGLSCIYGDGEVTQGQFAVSPRRPGKGEENAARQTGSLPTLRIN